MLKRILGQTAILSGGLILARLLNLGFRYVVARSISVEDYGRFALVVVVINYAALLGTFNLGNAASRFIPALPEERRPALLSRLGRLGGPIALLAMSGACGLLYALGYGVTPLVLAALAVAALTASNIAEGILRAFDLSRLQALNQVLTSGVRLVAAAAFVLVAGAGLTPAGAVILFTLGPVVGALFALATSRRAVRGAGWVHHDPGRRVSGGLAGGVLRYAAMLTACNLAVTGVGLVNRLLLTRHASFEEVAHYDNALLAYSMLQTLLASFVAISVPHYAGQDSSAGYDVVSVRKVGGVFLLAYGALAGAWLLGWFESLFDLLRIPGYLPMFPILMVVALSFPLDFIFVSVSSILQAQGRTGPVLVASLAATALAVLVGVLAIPRIGVTGAALSSLTGALALGLAATLLRRTAGLSLREV